MNQVTVTSVDFLNPTSHKAVVSVASVNTRVIRYFWQQDPMWRKIWLPNAIQRPGDLPVTIGNYGCLLTCIATLFQIEPDDLALANKDCFDTYGNMLTDKLLERLGAKLTRQDIPEGIPLPKKTTSYIARTSFYNKKERSGLSYVFPTHFYVVLPSGDIYDPMYQHNPNLSNKYKETTNQLRFITNTKI